MLRTNCALRYEYGALKVRLADSALDIDHYIEGKTAFLLRILELSGLKPEQLEEIQNINKTH